MECFPIEAVIEKTSGAVRQVYCEDALLWLERNRPAIGHSIVTSIPDFSEFPKSTIDQWKDWFVKTASLILSRTSENGVSVFYQSDIKYEGTWIDKGYLCQKAAESEGHELLWHKIACRVQPGCTTFGRPGYSHILCFSKNLRLEAKQSNTDVLPELGDKTWARGMGINACVMIAKFISELTPSHTVINPFCGEGSMLAAANAYGLSAIGIERSPKRAEKARLLQIETKEKRWKK